MTALALLLAALLAPAGGAPPGVLWRDPGALASEAPPAPPKPPFVFVGEDPSGTQPKLFARDAAGATWNVKFGYEVKNEVFCGRVARACGYFAEPGFYVAEGQFEGFRQMRRFAPSLLPDGRFKEARFQFRDPKLKFLPGRSWRWEEYRPPLMMVVPSENPGTYILHMPFMLNRACHTGNPAGILPPTCGNHFRFTT
jgi:hypothetical protein